MSFFFFSSLKYCLLLIQVLDYHGHQISDPYCWLEDPDSEQTKVTFLCTEMAVLTWISFVGYVYVFCS